MVLNLMIIEGEHTISEKTYVQHLTPRQDQKWWTGKHLIGLIWLRHAGISSPYTLLFLVSSILFPSQPKCMFCKTLAVMTVTIRRVGINNDATIIYGLID